MIRCTSRPLPVLLAVTAIVAGCTSAGESAAGGYAPSAAARCATAPRDARRAVGETAERAAARRRRHPHLPAQLGPGRHRGVDPDRLRSWRRDAGIPRHHRSRSRATSPRGSMSLQRPAASGGRAMIAFRGCLGQGFMPDLGDAAIVLVMLSMACHREPAPGMGEAERPDFGGDFTLTNQDNQPFHLKDVRARPSRRALLRLHVVPGHVPDDDVAHHRERSAGSAARTSDVSSRSSCRSIRSATRQAVLKEYVASFKTPIIALTGTDEEISGWPRPTTRLSDRADHRHLELPGEPHHGDLPDRSARPPAPVTLQGSTKSPRCSRRRYEDAPRRKG